MPTHSQLSVMFPPAPKFTDANLPSLAGKVFIVTGAASGVGYELAKILYVAGGTVYVAARSTARCDGAMEKILSETKAKGKGNLGKLASMVIDLSDLRTVKPAAEAFLSKESRLDLLMHNAAVMTPPEGSKDKLGHDLEFGTNCLGPYLLTLFLEPILIRTSTSPGIPAGTVRIVWVVSVLRDNNPPGAMNFEKDGTPKIESGFMQNYFASKNGASWLTVKFAERLGQHGILSVCLHPGLMKTELQRHWNLPMRAVMSITTKPCVYGAYSELYSGFSPEVTMKHNGGYLIAWGRISEMPSENLKGLKSEAEGGTGKADKFMAWCDREVKEYL